MLASRSALRGLLRASESSMGAMSDVGGWGAQMHAGCMPLDKPHNPRVSSSPQAASVHSSASASAEEPFSYIPPGRNHLFVPGECPMQT